MDAKSEAEKKKVKAEAALFKAHQENVSKLREEEEAKRREELEKEEVWDPIEYIIEDIRAGYVALIKVLTNAEGVEPKEMQLAIQRAKEIKATVGGDLGSRGMGIGLISYCCRGRASRRLAWRWGRSCIYSNISSLTRMR